MISKERPFIGITGIKTPQEASSLAKIFRQHAVPGSLHQGAAGYLANKNTIDGLNERSTKYPGFGTLPELLSYTYDAAQNIIHYNTQEKDTLPQQVITLFDREDIYNSGLCRTLQVNVKWPDVTHIEAIKTAFPDLRIILPLTPRMLKNQKRENIAENLEPYEPFIDYILIDPSGGKGKTFEPGWAAPYHRILSHYFPDKQIIFAGGFNDRNITSRLTHLFFTLASGNFGIDAESGLRDTDPHSRFGKLSLPKVEKYIKHATVFFSSTNGASETAQ